MFIMIKDKKKKETANYMIKKRDLEEPDRF